MSPSGATCRAGCSPSGSRRRLLPQDVVDQQNLIDGLNGLADALGLEKEERNEQYAAH